MVSQIPRSSQSRSRRQQVAGEGNSSGKSCQRAPLRRIHRIPSSTLRSLAGGLPPRGRRGRFGSKGRIFSHWASVSSRPYRAIGPPLALLPEFISRFRQTNHHPFSALYPVLKQALGIIKLLQKYRELRRQGLFPLARIPQPRKLLALRISASGRVSRKRVYPPSEFPQGMTGCVERKTLCRIGGHRAGHCNSRCGWRTPARKSLIARSEYRVRAVFLAAFHRSGLRGFRFRVFWCRPFDAAPSEPDDWTRRLFLNRLRIRCLADFEFRFDGPFTAESLGGNASLCRDFQFYPGCCPLCSKCGLGSSAEEGKRYRCVLSKRSTSRGLELGCRSLIWDKNPYAENSKR